MNKKINVLYLSNWSISEGITKSTVFPIIQALEANENVGQVLLCTIESNENPTNFFKKTIHRPLIKIGGDSASSKLIDLFRFPFLLRRIVKQHNIDIIWCRGSSAGGVGILANLITPTKLLVDSFEPHARYMIESKTWRWFSSKTIIQGVLEFLIKKRAFLLLPVSYKYQQTLISLGVAQSRLMVLPCVVDLVKFEYSVTNRQVLRDDLKLDKNDVVGIYVGKFGGLYYEKESIKLFQAAFNFWKEKFYLIILTEISASQIWEMTKDFNIPKERILIKKVDHSEVAKFLSASDFAFSTIKSVPIMENCSAIKHGEYWAADLPIISTLLVGDDAEIILNENAGCLIDIRNNTFDKAFEKIDCRLRDGRNGYYKKIAKKYRDISAIDTAINFALTSFAQNHK